MPDPSAVQNLIDPAAGLTAAQVLTVLGGIVTMLSAGFLGMGSWLLRVHTRELTRLLDGHEKQTAALMKIASEITEQRESDNATGHSLKILQLQNLTLQKINVYHDLAARGVNPSADISTEAGRHQAVVAYKDVLRSINDQETLLRAEVSRHAQAA